jgi:hypothetical protein
MVLRRPRHLRDHTRLRGYLTDYMIVAIRDVQIPRSILRVIAFILLCIGVQIAWNGLSVLIADLIRP